MRTPGIVLAAAIATAICFVSSSAAAQTFRTDRPYRGLFGGGVGSSDQTLVLNAQFGAGYDGNILASTNGISNDPTQVAAPGSKVTSASGGLSYSLAHKSFTFSANGNGWANYYPTLDRPLISSGRGGMNASWTISPKTTVSLAETVYDQPLYVLLAAPTGDGVDLTSGSSPQASTSARVANQLWSATSLTANRQLTKRMSIYANGGFLKSWATSTSSLQTTNGAAGLGFTLTKSLNLQVGYGEAQARYEAGGLVSRSSSSTATASLNFSHALSLTRRTTLAFTTGTAAVRDNGRTDYRVNGSAVLAREIARTWSATLAYNRDVGFLPPFDRPVFSDALTLGFGGLINRRIQLKTGAGATRGNVGLGVVDSSFSNYYGTAEVTFGLTRTLAFGLNYTFLKYSYGAGVDLPGGLARKLERQSARASINLWLPLYNVRRRP